MRIIYDDTLELAEVVIRCEDTARKGKCMWCPMFDRCMMDSRETRTALCGEIEPPKGAKE